jgi:phosphopantothenoylcysteine decarboxylase/phosphopantothenate--cysteine ligase
MVLPRSVLLIITGSVSAYKSLELIRLLRAENVTVHTILSKGGAKFVTPLAVSSLTGTKTYDDLFSLTDEVEMGHIQLSRIAHVVLVAPASADMLAKMVQGRADDLASTALLATNKPVIVAPAMNHKMWSHAATQRNIAQLKEDGVEVIEPTEGEMACGEFGVGRLAEPAAILQFLKTTSRWREVEARSDSGVWPPTRPASLPPLPNRPSDLDSPPAGNKLHGRRAIVTSGPTYEPIDPVRFLGNRSSGKQGHAIAQALAEAGADVTLISGPTALATPAGVARIDITTGAQMLEAAKAALPADIFVGAAAVADWKPTQVSAQKIKKQPKLDVLQLEFLPTDDILATIAQHEQRPALTVGFAAETEELRTHAKAKRMAKGADWILANDVSRDVFGSDENEILFISSEGEQSWPRMSKQAVAAKLVENITSHFDSSKPRLVKTQKG